MRGSTTSKIFNQIAFSNLIDTKEIWIVCGNLVFKINYGITFSTKYGYLIEPTLNK